MGIEYSEGDENVIVNNIYPREQEWVTKTITLTGWNTTDQTMSYDLGLNVISNTFNGGQLSLDLSLFDTSNVTDTTNMFQDATTTTGYARTQADADKFNSSSNKPVGLTFVVKPS